MAEGSAIMKITMTYNSHRMSIAVLAVATLVPLAADSYLTARVTAGEGTTDIRTAIQADRDRFAARRRGYEDALNQCQEHINQGQEITCPDFNDIGSYIDFARKYGYDGDTTSARQEQADQVTQRMSARLRAFVRRGYCPGFLKGSLAAACEQLLEANADVPTVGELGGFLNQRAAAAEKNFVERTLRDRINQMREALDRSNRRENVERPTVSQ